MSAYDGISTLGNEVLFAATSYLQETPFGQPKASGGFDVLVGGPAATKTAASTRPNISQGEVTGTAHASSLHDAPGKNTLSILALVAIAGLAAWYLLK